MSDDGKARRASVLLFEKWRAGEKIDAILQHLHEQGELSFQHIYYNLFQYTLINVDK